MSDDTMRAAFEAECTANHMADPEDFRRGLHGDYVWPSMNSAFRWWNLGWNARGEHDAKVVEHQCEICGNTPDADGVLEHGRGCFKVSSDGGGTEYIETDEDAE